MAEDFILPSINQPLVSLITIVYNGAGTLERTITSVLAQTYPNIEYIIIDGGSVDGSLDLIKRYDDNIDYWKSEPDNGISDAFNKGIAKANGSWVGIINADDWYEPDAIASLMAGANSDVGFVYGGVEIHSSDSNSHYSAPVKDYRRGLDYRMTIAHPSVLVKQAMYETHGTYNPSLRYAMDYDFFVRMRNADVSAIAIDKLIANWSYSGVSQQQYLSAKREVFNISTGYGCSRIKASLYFLVAIIIQIKRTLFLS